MAAKAKSNEVRHSDRDDSTLAWRGRRVPTWLAAVAVCVVAWLLYANTLPNGFVWDDRTMVVENPEIRDLDWAAIERAFTTHYWEMTGKPGGLYRPLSTLSFRLDYHLFGRNPTGFHFTNAVLNALVCALVFVFLAQLFGNAVLALIASLLFAAFPMHTENVAWVAGRTDLIAALFMMLSLVSYVAWRRRGGWWRFALTLLAFVAAVLGKEFALVLAPLLVVLEVAPFERLRRDGRGFSAVRLAAVGLVFFGIAAAYFVVRHAVLGRTVLSYVPFAHGVVQTAALALSILAHYVYQMLFPFVLNAESEFPVPTSFLNVHTLVGMGLVVLGAWVVWRWWRRGEVVLGVSLIGIGLAPVLNIFPITEVSADRFLYLPSLGFCLLVAALALRAPARWRSRTTAFLALLLVAYGVRTVIRNGDWRDESTLFAKTVAAASENARAHLNMGNVHYRAGRAGQALAEYRKALDIDPRYAGAWNASAGAYKDLGQLDEAFACMKRAIELEPTNANYQNSLGVLYVQRREFAEAIECFRRALRFDPSHRRAHFNLGLALYNNEQYRECIEVFSSLEDKDTDNPHAYYYMALSASHLGDRAGAADYAGKFLAVYHHDDDFRRNAQAILSGQAP